MNTLRNIKKIFTILKTARYKLVTAESMTGGMIGEYITSIPGSSEVYWGGIISYSIDSKIRILGVEHESIKSEGVVSKKTVESMASGALQVSGAHVSVAITGIAGPGSGSENGEVSLPAGTVWVATAINGKDGRVDIKSLCLNLKGTRNRIRRVTADMAIAQLLEHLETYVKTDLDIKSKHDYTELNPIL